MLETNIVFLLAPSCAGKDTAGNYLVEKYNYKRVSFADAVKTEYANINNINEGVLHNQGEEKEKHRPGLIKLAEEQRAIDPLCWLNKAFLPYQEESGLFKEGLNLVVTDCRRASEIEWVESTKELIQTVNENILSSNKNLKELPKLYYLNIYLVYIDKETALQEDKDVLTHYCIGYAKGRRQIDITIDNNGGLEDLFPRIDKLESLIKSTI